MRLDIALMAAIGILAVVSVAEVSAGDIKAVHVNRPCRAECVPLSQYMAEKRLATHRLRVITRLSHRARAWKRAATFRQGPVRAGLLCIHFNPRVGHGEGSWRDSGDPYWGGLQMDRTFMANYGRPLLNSLGLANRWPPEAQIAVGEIAYYAGRGFFPWPNTGRGCGLM